MAAASGPRSDDRFLCSVCLDVFNQPVSTPCGHNFCSTCICMYWDSSDACQCPLCKRTFSTRPQLQINSILWDLVGEFKKQVQIKASDPTPEPQPDADVLCEICCEKKEKAIKSCLTCLTSFCKVHLEPHQRVAGLKSHKLLEPVKNLDDKLCKTHNKITELYCRTDQACICVLCIYTDHKSHCIVPLKEEYETAMAKKDEAITNMLGLVQSQSEKIAEVENSLDDYQKKTENEKEACTQVFTGLIGSIRRSQADLNGVIEERHKAMKQKAEGFLRQLKEEKTELESRISQLQQLSQSEDHHHFLQSFPILSLPLNTDYSNICVDYDLSFEAVRGAMTLLEKSVLTLHEVMEELPEIKMKRMREHPVDLTPHPETAHCSLVMTEDRKQSTNEKLVQPLNLFLPHYRRFPKKKLAKNHLQVMGQGPVLLPARSGSTTPCDPEKGKAVVVAGIC
ncbi:E3 ubiquitin/ISG15 ligase TRIM25-like [Echeneis naucrates]|uniref:E3 ubiquitin/ISG15 ligase TRIM25-like n=1 Tax=Echeneis naucrates TaxID=173247 RepID=UPI001113C4C4|nr:E3 ubiquitin/ISG15 ligase TRIM25-like [Echeneis naucrates]